MQALVRRLHPDHPARQDGLTLLEVIVSLFILAIIMVPLVLAFGSAFLTTDQASTQLGRDGDQQRITDAWSRDVTGVDRGGVADTGQTDPAKMVTTSPCVDPSATTSTPLASFTTNSSVGANTGVGASTTTSTTTAASTTTTNPLGSYPVTQTTWSIEGAGVLAKLIRTTCVAGPPVAHDVVAENFGTSGATAASLVHGLGGQGTPFCTGSTCTIVISGAYNYSYTVGRRVPDLTISSLANAVPAPPVITSLTPQNAALSVGWNPPELLVGQPSIDAYQVDILTDALGNNQATTLSPNPGGTAVGAQLNGLTNGTPYWIRVRARNSVGWGPFSTIYGPASPQPLPPGGPTITAVVRDDHLLTASWPAQTGAAQYRLYAQDASGAEFGPTIVTGTTGTVTNLTNGVQYTLLVSAVNASGEGIRGPGSGPYRPHGPLPEPVNVTARASGSKRVTVDWTKPGNTQDDWINYNGNQPVGIRVAMYSINPNPSSGCAARHPLTNDCLTYVGGFYEHNYKASDPSPDTSVWGSTPLWNSPTSYNWQPTSDSGAIVDGRSYVVRMGIYGYGEEGSSARSNSSQDHYSVPSYANPLQYPGVTPAGKPGQVSGIRNDEHYSNRTIDMAFDAPGVDGIDALLNGGRAYRYLVEMQYRPKDSPNNTTWTNAVAPAPTPPTLACDPLAPLNPAPAVAPSGTPWCDAAGDPRPVLGLDRLVRNVGPLVFGNRYRIGMRISTVGEWPSAPEWWSDLSTYCDGNAGGNLSCAVDENQPSDPPRSIQLTRPANSSPRTLQLSFSPPATMATTRYSISCSAANGTTVAFVYPSSNSAAQPISIPVTGLTDGRNYSCKVQAGTPTEWRDSAQSNLAMSYGECRLVASADTYVDDENNGNHGGNGDLNVARNGAWYEGGAQSNRWALVKWDYTQGCSNYSNRAMSSSAYLVSTSFNIYISDGGTTRQHVVNLATSSWNEDQVWGNKPTYGAQAGRWSADPSDTGGNHWRSIDVVGQARGQKSGANNGWVIRDDGGDAYNFFALYASRENNNAAARPYLQILFYDTGR